MKVLLENRGLIRIFYRFRNCIGYILVFYWVSDKIGLNLDAGVKKTKREPFENQFQFLSKPVISLISIFFFFFFFLIHLNKRKNYHGGYPFLWLQHWEKGPG